LFHANSLRPTAGRAAIAAAPLAIAARTAALRAIIVVAIGALARLLTRLTALGLSGRLVLAKAKVGKG
jgi:hypothetical protein